MQPIEEIRHANLLLLIEEHGGQRSLADKVKKAPAQISQWVTRAPYAATGKPRVLGSRAARDIEAALDLPPGWMDQSHDAARLSTALPPVQAQPTRLDPERLALVLSIVDGAISDSRKRVPDLFRARMIARIYEGQHDLSGDTAEAVRALLAGLIETSESA